MPFCPISTRLLCETATQRLVLVWAFPLWKNLSRDILIIAKRNSCNVNLIVRWTRLNAQLHPSQQNANIAVLEWFTRAACFQCHSEHSFNCGMVQFFLVFSVSSAFFWTFYFPSPAVFGWSLFFSLAPLLAFASESRMEYWLGALPPIRFLLPFHRNIFPNP